MTLSPLRRLFIPLALLLTAILFRSQIIGLHDVYGQLFEWLPYVSLAIALLLCAFFNRSRLFTASLGLLTSYVLIQSRLQSSLTDPISLFIFTAMSLAIPLTVLMLLFTREHGLFNRYGLILVAVIPVQAVIGLALFNLLPTEELVRVINARLSIKPAEQYVLSLAASGIYFSVFLTGLYLLLKNNEETVAALIATLIFSYVTFILFNQTIISTLLYSAAGISMSISMLIYSYNMAYRDDLTGLLGRRALNDRMKGLGKQYVIAMMDIDHFKKFNDTYGHNIGDDVLKMVAKKIDAVQGGGTAYRYGGEEFCIVFPGKSIHESEPFLESIRKSVANHKITVRNVKQRPKSSETAQERRGRRSNNRGERDISVTISLGVAERNGKLAIPEQVLKAADEALYKAKEAGRNCLQIA